MNHSYYSQRRPKVFTEEVVSVLELMISPRISRFAYMPEFGAAPIFYGIIWPSWHLLFGKRTVNKMVLGLHLRQPTKLPSGSIGPYFFRDHSDQNVTVDTATVFGSLSKWGRDFKNMAVFYGRIFVVMNRYIGLNDLLWITFCGNMW